MSRVVTAPTLGAGPRRLGAAPREELDPVVRATVEQARAEAYARGHQDGYAEGRAETERASAERIAALGAAIEAALHRAAMEVRATGGATVAATIDLALAIAEHVVGREPHDGGAAISEQVRQALEELEDPAPTVCVHPGDTAVVTTALASHRAVAVEPDPTLRPGEARIRGDWARAELTYDAAFTAMRRELGADG